MSEFKITCEQAIFTSIRTAMGEGYRIIASSKGLRPDEKQTITRNSPSHDALCSDTPAFAFYSLPSGRLCAACSCFAGAEHTGRGGQRVYTHSAVFSAKSFEEFGYNPFHVLRAMQRDRVTEPKLNPQPILEELPLIVRTDEAGLRGEAWRSALSDASRRFVLQGLLGERAMILNLTMDWFEAAEALILGIPGPLRPRISFCAGSKFSAGRNLRLHLLRDSTPTTRNRSAGQRVEYVDRDLVPKAPETHSAWASWVNGLWERGDLAALSRRTSRAFKDASLETRERAGRWYGATDGASQTETGKLLSMMGETLEPRSDRTENEIIAEMHLAVQQVLLDRFQNMTWPQIALFWPALVQVWRRGEAGCRFAQPLVVAALRRASRENPMAAAEAAVAVGRDIPPHAQAKDHQSLLDDTLRRLAEWAGQIPDDQRQPIRGVAQQWRVIRPGCELVGRIFDALRQVAPCG